VKHQAQSTLRNLPLGSRDRTLGRILSNELGDKPVNNERQLFIASQGPLANSQVLTALEGATSREQKQQGFDGFCAKLAASNQNRHKRKECFRRLYPRTGKKEKGDYSHSSQLIGHIRSACIRVGSIA